MMTSTPRFASYLAIMLLAVGGTLFAAYSERVSVAVMTYAVCLLLSAFFAVKEDK